MSDHLLIGHPSLQPLQPHFDSYAIKGLEAVLAKQTTVKATASEYFAQAVYDRVGELDSALASLRLVQRFLDELSCADDPDPEVCRYHYENFVYRGIGVVDRAFLLVADALMLSKKARRSSQLIEERAQAHPRIHAALLNVKALLQPYRRIRNTIVHDSAFSDRTLGVLAGARQMKLDVGAIDVAAIARETSAGRAVEVGAVIDSLPPALEALLAALGPIFDFVAARAEETA